MRLNSFLACFAIGALMFPALAQSPKPPFTAKDAAEGKRLGDLSLDLREQITKAKGPADPFKIMGNLYFVGVNNGARFIC